MSRMRKKSREPTSQAYEVHQTGEELKQVKPSTSSLTKGKSISVDYRGVYLHYVSPDGSEKWRAHFYWYPIGEKLEKLDKDDIKRNKKSVQTIGYYDTAKEAAEAYDDFVREHKLPMLLNFPTKEEKEEEERKVAIIPDKRLLRQNTKIPIKTQNFLRKYSEFVDFHTLSSIVGIPHEAVQRFLVKNNLKLIRERSTIVVFDIRDNYETDEGTIK